MENLGYRHALASDWRSPESTAAIASVPPRRSFGSGCEYTARITAIECPVVAEVSPSVRPRPRIRETAVRRRSWKRTCFPVLVFQS